MSDFLVQNDTAYRKWKQRPKEDTCSAGSQVKHQRAMGPCWAPFLSHPCNAPGTTFACGPGPMASTAGMAGTAGMGFTGHTLYKPIIASLLCLLVFGFQSI